MRTLHLVAAATLSLSCALLATPQEAQACGNSMRYDRNNPNVAKKPAPRLKVQESFTTLEAEQSFKKGDWRKAVRRAMIAHPTLQKRSRAYKGSEDRELQRAAWIAAIAVTRANGSVALDAGAATVHDYHKRRRQLDWAVETLQWAREQSDGDPRMISYLAEAYARGADTRARALELLEDLRERDLVPDAHGWATLAALHAEKGQSERAKQARERCAKIGAPAVACDGSRVLVIKDTPPLHKSTKKARRKKSAVRSMKL